MVFCCLVGVIGLFWFFFLPKTLILFFCFVFFANDILLFCWCVLVCFLFVFSDHVFLGILLPVLLCFFVHVVILGGFADNTQYCVFMLMFLPRRRSFSFLSIFVVLVLLFCRKRFFCRCFLSFCWVFVFLVSADAYVYLLPLLRWHPCEDRRWWTTFTTAWRRHGAITRTIQGCR